LDIVEEEASTTTNISQNKSEIEIETEAIPEPTSKEDTQVENELDKVKETTEQSLTFSSPIPTNRPQTMTENVEPINELKQNDSETIINEEPANKIENNEQLNTTDHVINQILSNELKF
jgi:hypothetical protein